MKTIGFVDDEESIRNGYIKLINWTEAGFKVKWGAANGVEAMCKLEADPVDLIITDIRMPMMNGLELARLLSREYPQVKKIFLSAYNDMEYVNEGMACGVDGYILKTEDEDPSITPTTGTVDKYNATDLVIAKTDGSYNLNAIKNGATTLTPNVDYSISGNTVTFKADYLKTLAKGTATLTFDYNGGTDPTLILTVTADTSVDYDVDNGDITITDNGDGSVTIEQGGNSTNVSDECEIIIGGGTGNVINNGAENVTIDGNLTGNITTSNGGQTTVDGNITGNISTDGAGSDTIVKGDVTGDVGTSDGAKTDVDGKVTGDVTTDGQGSKTEVGNSIGGSTNNTNGGSTSSNTNNIGNGGTNTGNSNTSSSGGGGGSGVVTYKNSTSSSNNGAVTVSPTNAEAGKAVTVTVKPNSGYELNVLTVKDASGKTITTTKKSDTSYTYTMPDSAVTITATFKVEGSVSYNDVAASAWYYDAVSYVTEHNIMQGVGDNKFAPDSKTNRGMMVQILYNMEGKPAVNDSSAYADVASGQWYTDAVVWATGKGIVTGYGDNKFGPEDNVTNEQMLTILYRYATYKGYTIANGNGYTDNAQPSDWAKTFVNWGYGNGMISSQTSSAPTGASIRCQIAHALYVFCENVAK